MDLKTLTSRNKTESKSDHNLGKYFPIFSQETQYFADSVLIKNTAMNCHAGDKILYAMYEKEIKIECVIVSITGDTVIISDSMNERNKSVISIKDIKLEK